MQITINMTEFDFERIFTNSMRWGLDWGREEQRWRFEPADEDMNKYGSPPEWTFPASTWQWSHAYWLGDSWTNVMFARSFLEAQGQAYEVLWDMAENPTAGYVILTNYASPCWRRMAEIDAS